MEKKNQKKTIDYAASIRARAEKRLSENADAELSLPSADIEKLVQELSTYQIELELQNEELRHAQMELSQSRDRFVDLFDFAPIGYVSMDPLGRILEANLKAAALLEVDRKQLIGANISRWLNHSAQAKFHLHKQAVFSSDASQNCEVQLQTASGRSVVVRLDSIAFEEEHRRQCRTALIDMTEVRDTQQQLQESEQRYQRLTNALTDYVYSVQVQSGRSFVNIHGLNCEAVTGYTDAEFHADPALWTAIVFPDDRPMVEQQVADILSGRPPAPIEHRILRKDGQTRWVRHTVSLEFNLSGQLAGYDGLVRDITPRKQAETALSELNANLEQRVAEQTLEVQLLAEAMANLGEGVIITSNHLDLPNPEIVYVNKAITQITGYSADELIRQSPRVLQGPDTDQATLQELRQALSAGQPHRCELVNYRKDGTPYNAEIFATPLFDTRGNHINFIGIHRDITDRKRAETAFQESHAQTQAILASLQAHIAVIDNAGIITAVNPAWVKLAAKNNGDSTRCSVGNSYLEVCRTSTGPFQDEAKRAADGLQAILDGRIPEFTMEYTCRSETTPHWFLLQAMPLRNKCGGAVISHTNITQRVEAEQRLRNNEERHRAILNTASDAIITMNEQGIIDSVNPATTSMFGYTSEELKGRNIKLLLPTLPGNTLNDDITSYPVLNQSSILGKGREATGRRKNGSVFPIDLAINEVADLGLFTSAIRDLSARKSVEEKLRREQELAKNIADTAQYIVLLLDSNGCIVQFNHYTSKLTGWQLDEVRGKSWFTTFLRKSDQPIVRDVFKHALSGQSTKGNINVILTKDGREREVEWHDAALTDADGKFIGLLCTGQDVTENRRLARYVLNAATEAQRRIGQDLHDSVGQEVAGLTMMAGALAKSLQETAAPESMTDAQHATHMQISVDLATGMQNALKQLKAVARGLHPVEVDSQGLCSSLKELAQHVSERYPVDCQFIGNKRVKLTDVETATHLFRIAQEAVTNAAVHSRTDRIEISLEESNNILKLNIRDYGEGIHTDMTNEGGMGLQSMKYRTGLIGGHLSIAPYPDGGTLVSCTWQTP